MSMAAIRIAAMLQGETAATEQACPVRAAWRDLIFF
jgi:hypothetical protein